MREYVSNGVVNWSAQNKQWLIMWLEERPRTRKLDVNDAGFKATQIFLENLIISHYLDFFIEWKSIQIIIKLELIFHDVCFECTCWRN